MVDFNSNTKHKVFVSYKYGDSDVYPLFSADRPIQMPSMFCLQSPICGARSTARDYVNEFMKITEKNIIIYKGEKDGEDLSHLSDNTIQKKLSDRIFDSSLTIVFISPKMKENKPDKEQWIHWEVFYSLRRTTRDGRQSQPNALLYVILPDSRGGYEYVERMRHFEIIMKNYERRYAEFVRWDCFKSRPEYWISRAYGNKNGRAPVVLL